MIVLPVAQGSQAWLAARLGIPTASCFDRIITKSGKPSSSSKKYLLELVAERILGVPLNDFSSAYMARGQDLEAQAVSAYELEQDITTTPVGFVLRDDRRCGASPDRLVGDAGLLEVKCVSAAIHVGAMLGLEDESYIAQVQGQMWVADREWCDRIFYNPAMPTVRQRVMRDEEFIAALADEVNRFCGALQDAEDMLRAKYGDEILKNWQAL